ncbi:hypothetical protein [Streptomyces sp. G1]|uniref:hypothetical protein n=1 Tax=Streptomyces sp. G1 TaxID=361572 RepID=UPI00202FFF31|nr:hypothetical protein [Streptomyces sp. G1]MCM1964894.1 hypothetical protein [Streptomyces sp. G1]
MFNPLPKLTFREKAGALACTNAPDPEAPTTACEAPADWHIAWTLTPGAAWFSLACTPCMDEILRHNVFTDRHPARPECDLPGTGWETAATPSYCVWTTTN